MFQNPFRKRSKTKSIVDLSDYQRNQIEELLEEGKKPTEVTDLLGIDIAYTRKVKDVMRKQAEKSKSSNSDDKMTSIRAELEQEKLKAELEHLKQKNSLDLTQMRLDLWQQQRMMYQEFQQSQQEDPEDPIMDAFEDNPIVAVIKFLKELKSKNETPSPPVPPTPPEIPQFQTTLDPNQTQQTYNINKTSKSEAEQDLTDLQIQDLLAKIPNDLKELAMTAPLSTIKKYIKNKYPLSDKTIERAVDMLKSGVTVEHGESN